MLSKYCYRKGKVCDAKLFSYALPQSVRTSKQTVAHGSPPNTDHRTTTTHPNILPSSRTGDAADIRSHVGVYVLYSGPARTVSESIVVG